MVALCLGGGAYGLTLGSHLTQSGFYDDNSESAKASRLADQVYGRDTSGHIVAIYTAPDGKTVDDRDFDKKILDNLARVEKDHPNEILRSVGYFKSPRLLRNMADASRKHAFMSIQLKGNDDDTILNNYKTVRNDFDIPGVDVKLAGLQPLANELMGTIAEDQLRAEVLAVPLVAVVLFFVFGGVVAACLPAMVGALSIAGSLGIMRLVAISGPVHYFAQPVVTLIGLGIAIDYGLFVVSRFREEIAEGYDTETAVRRAVMTAGRTVVFSSVLIVASAAGLLLFPQGFLKSLTYAMIASVTLSAILSITVLPACLALLGRHVDDLGVYSFLRVPFFRNWKPTNWWLHWLGARVQKNQTREEVENGFWGKLVNRVMKRPIVFAAPIVILMIWLIVPLGNMSLGGISEKYLPPTNSVRQAQQEFDRTFPRFRTEPLTLVIHGNDHRPVTDNQVAQVRSEAMTISGFIDPDNNPANMWKERPYLDGASKDPSVRVIENGLVNRNDAATKVGELRSISPPRGLTVWVGGTPALEQDSIHSIFAKLPLMAVILIGTTTLLMFLAFGSLVLPIKAAIMSALTLGSTLGVLTWIFVDGHFSSALNFTPTPLTAPVIGLVIAVVYGLSTDYEVFLVSRMVEARDSGTSTADAIRIGTATTGRLITAAALVLVVVAGAFVFSDLVMMKYLAFGLVAALLLDATVIRMFLVPAVMKMLGDDCWWAPQWMKRIQVRLGLGEIELPDERKRPTFREPQGALVGAGAPVRPRPPHDPGHPDGGTPRPGGPGRPPPPPRALPPSTAGTTRIPIAPGTQPGEPPTTRFKAPTDATPAANAVPDAPTTRTPRAAPNRSATPTTPPTPTAPPSTRASRRAESQRGSTQDREIESWLGALRGSNGAPSQPVDEPTTAIPTQRPQEPGATEKIATREAGDDEPKRRGGGGVSASDLLRREGRL